MDVDTPYVDRAHLADRLRTFQLWYDAGLLNQDPLYTASIPTDDFPGVSRPTFLAHEQELYPASQGITKLALEDYLFATDETLAAVLQPRHGVAPSYAAYVLTLALNPHITPWSDPALWNNRIRIPTALDQQWNDFLGGASLSIRDEARFQYVSDPKPHDFLSHAAALDYYASIVDLDPVSVLQATDALSVINLQQAELPPQIRNHVVAAAQQAEKAVETIATSSYPAESGPVALPDDFLQRQHDIYNAYMASVIATASALAADRPTCHHLVVPTPNSGRDIHDLRVYWISSGDYKQNRWEEATPFSYHSSPADTCGCNVPLVFAIVYAKDAVGNRVSEYYERDLTIPPDDQRTTFTLDVSHEDSGFVGPTCTNYRLPY